MLDLKEAFYRIFRPLCMDGPVTDQALAHLMQRLQMPADAMVELRRLLCDPCALEQAGLTSQQCRSIRAVHSQTFFWMHHQRDVVQTTQGSRAPGDPFADIIFSYVWAVVLKKLQAFMQQQGIISEFVRRPYAHGSLRTNPQLTMNWINSSVPRGWMTYVFAWKGAIQHRPFSVLH